MKIATKKVVIKHIKLDDDDLDRFYKLIPKVFEDLLSYKFKDVKKLSYELSKKDIINQYIVNPTSGYYTYKYTMLNQKDEQDSILKMKTDKELIYKVWHEIELELINIISEIIEHYIIYSTPETNINENNIIVKLQDYDKIVYALIPPTPYKLHFKEIQ